MLFLFKQIFIRQKSNFHNADNDADSDANADIAMLMASIPNGIL